MSFNKNNNKNNNSSQPTEEGFIKVSLVNQSVFIRRKRSCPLKDISIAEINYKNLTLLNKFLSERGRILPSRITSVIPKKQRALKWRLKSSLNPALLIGLTYADLVFDTETNINKVLKNTFV